jgi:hypothetical protein
VASPRVHQFMGTYSPVGGMSGFATICYICSYPALASILLAFSLSAMPVYSGEAGGPG